MAATPLSTSRARFPLALLALLLSALFPTCTAQRSADARLLYLADDCGICVTVDADAGEFAQLTTGDCRNARTRDKYWILDGESWCLDEAPHLCVEEGGTLLLSDRSSSRWQDFDFDNTNGNGRIVGDSGDCVTVAGSTLRMSSCGTSNRNQEWQLGRDYCQDADSSADDGTLIFLDRECNECLGVDRSADDEVLIIVECDDTSALRHWALDYLGSSDIVESWCLASNTNLCVSEVGSSLRLRDDSADSFIFNNGVNDEIESVDNANQCVTRMGSNLVMQSCRSNVDQRWTKEQQNYWDSVCISDGLVIYNESQCGVCIVASGAGVGSQLVEGDCDTTADDRKFFTFQGDGYWCLEADDTICVETDSAGRLTLRNKSTDQRQEWVYDSGSNEIQPFVSSDLCVARQSGGVEVESCNRVSGSAASWIMADYEREYRDDCIRQQGNNPCEDGDLFNLDSNCNLCVGVSGDELVVVDCTNAPDAEKLWEFTDNGLWRLRNDRNLCVGPDLQLKNCVTGQQSLWWTYSDTSQIGSIGQRKIARWSAPNSCIARRGLDSSSLELVSCRSSSTAFNLDFGYATNTCDYNCFDVMSADLEGTDATSGGDSVVRWPILSALASMVVIISLF